MALEAFDNNPLNKVEAGAERTAARLGHHENTSALDAAKNVIDLNSRKKLDSLSKNIGELEREIGSGNSEISRIKNALASGEITSPREVIEAERTIQDIALREGEKTLKDAMDPEEDKATNNTSKWIAYMSGLDTAVMIGELKEIKKTSVKLEKQKREVQALEAKSPRAYKEYIKRVHKAEKTGNSGTISRKEILKNIKETFAKAIDAPAAVQREFFELVEKGKLKKDDYGETLKGLTAEHEQKIKEYLSLIDPEIFGEKPAKEFEKYIKERKSFSEISFCLGILKNKYIPERKQAQSEFEDLPQEVKKEHEKSWKKELGYSERRALLDSLHQLEHKENNPLAQEYLKQLTQSKKEVAATEWPELMREFLQYNYEDQETLLKAFSLKEMKKRKELVRQYEELPKEVQESETGREFFTLKLDERIVLLRDLKKITEEEGGKENPAAVLDTETGRSVYNRMLQNIVETTQGQAKVTADVLAHQTHKIQSETGKVKVEDRQEKLAKSKAGERAGEKVSLVHELSNGDITIDAETGAEKDLITMDLYKLKQGSMQRSESAVVKRELIEGGYTNESGGKKFEDADFVAKAGQSKIDFQKNEEQRNQLQGIVEEMLIDALLQTVESMKGQRVSRESLPELTGEQSRQMLDSYRRITKQNFHGLEGESTREKSNYKLAA